MQFVAEDDEDLPDGIMARRAIDKLHELADQEKPFFMGLGFFKPHLPFVAPKRDWDAIAQRDVPRSPRPDKVDSSYWHRSGEFYGYDAPFPKTNPLAAVDQITTRRAYLACVRYVDRQVGKVLTALDDLGLSSSTIVVVWGDHGWHLGDSAIWGKHTPFERALKSTLIVRAPGVSVAGTKCDALVETLDLFPTLVDLCDPQFKQTAYRLDGHSLRRLLTGETTPLRDAAVSYWRSAVSVRTPTHRLITTIGKHGLRNTELYDLRQSPDPVKNLVAEQTATAERMLRLIPNAAGAGRR